MSKKIVLFLSAVGGADVPEQTYLCPDGSTVTGKQTNEAPVRYLMRSHPDVSEVVCIVTKAAKETAWDAFCSVVRQEDPSVEVTEIPYGEEDDFSSDVLVSVLSRLGPGDGILLETTGGLRDTVMQLLLLSRVLSYKGIRTVCAVYSNFQKRRVEDVSHLIGLFDLVGGMQELVSFGSVRTLRAYYGKPARTDTVEELLTAMEKLNEAIVLCRANHLDQAMKRFSRALKAAEGDASDPLMQALLPVFREKFGEEMTIPDLIDWCVENDMLQQALTIYTELVPELIMEYIEEPAGVLVEQREYEKDAAVRFLKGFLMLSCKTRGHPRSSQVRSMRNFINSRGRDLEDYVFGSASEGVIWPNIRVGARRLKEVIWAAYPEDNDRFDPNWRERIPDENGFLRYLSDENWRRNLNTMLATGMDDRNLCALFGGTAYTLTLQNLNVLLPDSGYRLKCSADRIRALSRDYLYIKALRNMTNHANSEETTDQELLMDYLAGFGYVPLSDVTMEVLKRAVLTGVKRLREKEHTR